MRILEESARTGQSDYLISALADGEPVNGEAGPLDSPLYAAARYGHEFCVELLLNAGAEPHQEALRSACRHGHWDCALLLLEAGAKHEEGPLGSLSWVRSNERRLNRVKNWGTK
jgi:ankyrin repeat protein